MIIFIVSSLLSAPPRRCRRRPFVCKACGKAVIHFHVEYIFVVNVVDACVIYIYNICIYNMYVYIYIYIICIYVCVYIYVYIDIHIYI